MENKILAFLNVENSNYKFQNTYENEDAKINYIFGNVKSYDFGIGNGGGTEDGIGFGNGTGSGCCYCISTGEGWGEGEGCGDISGNGIDTDTKYKKNIIIKNSNYHKGILNKEIATLDKLNGESVYYVNNIPCIFLAIKNNIAEVNVINNDFSLKKIYIVKKNDFFVHVETLEEATQELKY